MLTISRPWDCGALVTTIVVGCDEVVVVMSSFNDIMDLIGLPGISLTSLVSSVFMFKVNDVWLLVACGHTPDDAK